MNPTSSTTALINRVQLILNAVRNDSLPPAEARQQVNTIFREWSGTFAVEAWRIVLLQDYLNHILN